MTSVSAKELMLCMEALPRQRFRFLVNHVLKIESGMDCEALSTYQVVSLGLADWMTALGRLDDDAQQCVLLKMSKPLEKYARAFDVCVQRGETTRPVAQLGLFDFRYVSMPAHWHSLGFYDLVKDAWTDTMPYQAMTLVYCDLAALLVRLTAAADRRRNAREHADAGKQPASG